MLTAPAVCHTMRSATGFTAGPEKPPTFLASTAFLFFRSMRIPRSVLMRETASAPPASTALAISTISVTFGVSLIITGFFDIFFTSSVTRAAMAGSVPKAMPPPLTLGQEILISNMEISGQSLSIRTASQYSSILCPAIFVMIFVSNRERNGSSASLYAAAPGF